MLSAATSISRAPSFTWLGALSAAHLVDLTSAAPATKSSTLLSFPPVFSISRRHTIYSGAVKSWSVPFGRIDQASL